MVAVPATRTRLSHALTIRVGGRTIGAIHSWSFSQSRTVEDEFEVERNAVGMPCETVPQTVGARELRIGRYDLYTSIMEEVFGTSEVVVLTDQTNPFTLREIWKGPSAIATAVGLVESNSLVAQLSASQGTSLGGAVNNVLNANPTIAGATSLLGAATADTRVYVLGGCWFTNVGRQIDAKSDRVISVEATMNVTTRRRAV